MFGTGTTVVGGALLLEPQHSPTQYSWGLFREISLRLSAACWRSRQVREKCLRSNQCEKAMAGLHNAEEMLESINADECEAPDVLSWREWQTWRAREGRRPAVRRGDTTSTTISEEGVMRRAVMAAVHGPEWRADLRPEKVDPGFAGGSELLGDVPEGVPAAVDDAAGAAAPAASTIGQGGGSRSRFADTASSGRPGAEELRRRLLLDIDPIKETLPVFLSRIDRIAMVIAMHADSVSLQDLTEIKVRAEYMSLMHGLAGDSQVTFLKDQLQVALMTEEVSADERGGRTRAIIELLRVRGQRASKNEENLFSTATNSKDPTPDRAFPNLTQRVMNPTPAATPQPKRSASGVDASLNGGLRTPRERSRVAAHDGGLRTPRGRSRDFDEASIMSPERGDAIVEALHATAEQTKAMMLMMSGLHKDKKKLSSTIRVNPTIQWPRLSDDGPYCREVDEFFDKFDETCALANDGEGMADRERLKVLASCLKGSRAKTYQVLHKKHRLLGEVDSDPGKVLSIIRAKLMRFVEGSMEKQMRVLAEWDNLIKGKLSALDFEPRWEGALAELESVGLARNVRELMLNYLSKVGPALAAEIQKDMRAWPDGIGGFISRRASTWEECHDVCLELESLKQGGKALNSFPNTSGPDLKDEADDEPAEDKPAGISARSKWVCYEFRDTGKCSWGAECGYSHNKHEVAKSRQEKEAAEALKTVVDAAVRNAVAVNAQTKGRAKGGNGKGSGKGEQKDRLCNFVKRGETCPFGDNCRYSHDEEAFKDEKPKNSQSQSNPKPQDDDGDWGKPIGLKHPALGTRCLTPSLFRHASLVMLIVRLRRMRIQVLIQLTAALKALMS